MISISDHHQLQQSPNKITHAFVINPTKFFVNEEMYNKHCEALLQLNWNEMTMRYYQLYDLNMLKLIQEKIRNALIISRNSYTIILHNILSRKECNNNK